MSNVKLENLYTPASEASTEIANFIKRTNTHNFGYGVNEFVTMSVFRWVPL